MTIGALLPLVAALAAQAGYTLVSQREAMVDGLEAKAEALAGLMVNVAGPSIAFDDDKAVGDGLGFVASDPDFGFAAAIGADGRSIGFRTSGVDHGAVRGLLVPRAHRVVVRHGDLLIAATPVISDDRQLGTVFIGLHTEGVHAQVVAMSIWATAISIIGIAIAVIVVLVLAGKITRRNQQMRLVLDNVDEALATIRRDGTLEPECSAAFVRWFGAPGTGSFAAQVAGDNERMREMLALAWSEIVEDVMPIDLLVDQFPSRLDRDGHHFRIDIKPLFERDALTGAMLRIRDVTAEVEAQRTLDMQREYVAVFERALADPHGVRAFIEDTSRLVAELPEEDLDPVVRMRAAHTIKGNAAIYGVQSVAEAAHRLEDQMLDAGPVDPGSVQELVQVWAAFAGRVERLLGSQRDKIDITRVEIEALAELAERGGATAAERLRALLLEPVALRFDAIRRQIGRLAERLGKPAPEVAIDADAVRLAPDRLRSLWGAFAHLVRNAVDHGVEPADERTAAGKPEAGRIELRARVDGDLVTLEIADDGRGIAWDRVRERARAAGLPAETETDLVGALFCDGVSTADQVTDVSGRGVGLAAVRAAVREMNGRIEVHSVPGRGTRFTFTFASSAAPHARRSRPTFPPDPSAEPAQSRSLS